MSKFYIGVDVGGTNLKAAVLDETFATVAEKRVLTRAHLGPDAVLQNILEIITALLSEQNLTTSNIRCVGIAVPGIADSHTGVARFCPNLPGWHDIPVAPYIKERLGIPVFINNDVRAHLYGEWALGAARGKQNVVLAALGTGLGAGVMIDGHILYGATMSAGEIGHIKMVRGGRPCKCGSSGCLGRYVSAVGLMRTLREKLESGRESVLRDWTGGDLDRMTGEMIAQAFDAGDAVAMETFRTTGEMLGFGLCSVINLYNPERIVIGGGMAAAGERLLGRTREIVHRHALKIPGAVCDIVTAQLGDAAGMIGVAVFASRIKAP